MNTKKKSKIWILLFAVALLGFSYAILQIFIQLMSYRQARQEYNSVKSIAYGRPMLSAKEAEEIEATDTAVAFEALIEKNPDTIGWIRMIGTAIDYPVMRSYDNVDYLYTTFQKVNNPAGSIFIDYRNSPDFSDTNTFIYGHNMKDGSMFATLMKYDKQEFYEENPSFLLYTQDEKFVCEIFSAHFTDISDPTFQLGFDVENNFEEYMSFIREGSLVETKVKVNEGDRIVSLSTCDNINDNTRFVVHARLAPVK